MTIVVVRGTHDVVFRSAGRPPRSPPHPGFERGLVLDMAVGAARACGFDLPWPAECVGTWEVRCRRCGLALAVTAAGRVDDPRRLRMPCGTAAADIRTTERRPWRPDDGDPAIARPDPSR